MRGNQRLDQFAQVFKTADRIGNGAAFHTEDNIVGALLDHIDDLFPIDHTITASAANRGAGNFTAFLAALRHADILGVQVNKSVYHVTQPFISIVCSSQEAIPSIIVDPDSRGFHQVVDAIQTFERLAVLLVGFQTDLDAISFGNHGSFLECVGHQGIVHLFGGPLGLWDLHRY